MLAMYSGQAVGLGVTAASIVSIMVGMLIGAYLNERGVAAGAYPANQSAVFLDGSPYYVVPEKAFIELIQHKTRAIARAAFHDEGEDQFEPPREWTPEDEEDEAAIAMDEDGCYYPDALVLRLPRQKAVQLRDRLNAALIRDTYSTGQSEPITVSIDAECDDA